MSKRLGILTAVLGLFICILALAANHGPANKVDLELTVSLNDKKVGQESLRKSVGKEGTFYSTEAQLQDKVKKVWRSFKQRAFLNLTPQGEVQGYDRWIDVVGTTIKTKVYNFNGQWKISIIDEQGGKPKVLDLKVKQPLVIFDERMPSLIAVAVERMVGKEEFDYVRVDNATFGKMTQTSEHLVDGKGNKFTRFHLKAGSTTLEVLRDGHGQVLTVKGFDGWKGELAGAKLPAGLTPAPKAEKVEKPVEKADDAAAGAASEPKKEPGKDTEKPAKDVEKPVGGEGKKP